MPDIVDLSDLSSSSAAPASTSSNNPPAPVPSQAAPASAQAPAGSGLVDLSDLGGTGSSQAAPQSQESPQDLISKIGDSAHQVWDWANKPLLNLVRPEATGFEKGAEEFVSNFSSPLSIALMLSTAGTGGLLESAGASALKEAGLTAAEIADATKGVQIAKDAVQAGKPITQSLVDAGLNPDKYGAAIETLSKAGLREGDLLGGNLIDQAAGSIARKFGASPADSVKIAKGLQLATAAGFTYQAGETAVQLSARTTSALKDAGNPDLPDDVRKQALDEAKQYGLEALTGAVLGAVGLKNSLTTAGELFTPTPKLKLSDENIRLKKVADTWQLQRELGNKAGNDLDAELYKTLDYKHKHDLTSTKSTQETQQQRLAEMGAAITHDNDPELLRQVHNAIAKAAGRDDEIIPSPSNIEASHPKLPTNLDKLIQDSDIQNQYTPAELDKTLKTFKGAYGGASGGWSDPEKTVMKRVRESLDKGLEQAQAAGAIGEGVENYLRRLWEKPEEGPSNEVIHDARLGRMNYDVPMAKKRIFETEIEGILKGYKLRTRDPIALASQWVADMGTTIANRNFIDELSSHYLRASDGMPAVTFQGTGHPSIGMDGSNPATYINPHAVRTVKIADHVVEDLRKSGSLDRHLDRGTIVEQRAPITPENLDATIRGIENYVTKNGSYPRGVLASDLTTLKDIQAGKGSISDLAEINERRPPQYAWSPKNYITLDHPSFREWRIKTTDPEGNPVWVNSNMQVHPEYLNYIKNRLGIGDRADFAKTKPGQAVLKAGSQIKGTLLGLSPFHLVQEGLRAAMTGISPVFGDLSYDFNDTTEIKNPNGTVDTVGNRLKRLVQNNLTLTPEYRGLQEALEGLSGQSAVLDKIPFIGHAQNWFHDFLFRRYLPALKSRASLHLYEKYQDAHPDWTPDAVAKIAAEHTNNAFGGQNWKAMGRSMAQQDWSRLLALAPDWLESEMRFAGQLFNKQGGIARADVAKFAVTMYGVARALNMLNSGNMHLEAPFGVVSKDKNGRDVVYSVRTFPGDLFEMAQDPVKFLKGRLSPVARGAQEVWTSRDAFDKKVPISQAWFDAVKQSVPIPIQQIGQIVNPNSQQVGTGGQVVKAAGGTVKVYKSPAQQKAADLSFAQSKQGDSPEEVAKHRMLVKYEDDLRSGLATREELNELETRGIITQADRRKIIDNVKETVGMSPENARLYAQSQRLGAPQFLQVWEEASPSERIMLTPLLRKKRGEYMRWMNKNLPPQSRQNDPTAQKFSELFAGTE